MSLIGLEDISPGKDRPAPNTIGHRPVSVIKEVGSGTAIEKALPEIIDGYTYHLPCFVNWSLHDLLSRILALTGPAHVCLTSWAISEEPARKISRLVSTGQILTMHCLFDHRVTKYCPSAMQLATGQLGQVKLVHIHAKILVVQNDSWGISVTSTANATNKKRIEKYVITCDLSVAEFERQWIMKLFEE